MSNTTLVHLLRHGEVFNPEKILYGRIPGYRLSERGIAMAEMAAEHFRDLDVTYLVSSPLERALQTAEPIGRVKNLTVNQDQNLLEATNVFEGKRVSVGDGVLRKPTAWRHLWNPFRPSWGEPYVEIFARMQAAVTRAKDLAFGHQAVLVSHQLPIWIARLGYQNHRFVHNPAHRECNLASVTTLKFHDHQLVSVSYSEPAAALYKDSSGGVGA
jgi:broad specificity phosphatase PhoE